MEQTSTFKLQKWLNGCSPLFFSSSLFSPNWLVPFQTFAYLVALPSIHIQSPKWHLGGLLELFSPHCPLLNQLPSPQDFTTQIFSQICSFLSILTIPICHFTWSSVPVSLFGFHTLLTQHSNNVFVLNNPAYTYRHRYLGPPNPKSLATCHFSPLYHCSSFTLSLEFSSVHSC